ncbi:hypothetical protein EMIHUDRAFT_458609 [Emiliania huxleyi CCMP1516]|uniref:Uncharacterized protein n=2 Tax=Emiliania huxleyi TaxID=2903 RepID=A0A0D3J9M1_EMIH1|nr:hypothetical protein EMIHUDRAFT_458609 [Emiliania huxleyi CCMP1516]EOD20206.1 hypothetical protein EMIHUDRAFT_458609 [Emiliania huxleyi CCMP1516]|eukprot:XP_005772635.1 hypothetical protein EMIHUDRAFT_458609 [Emiliania huxleyi CCMP1516]
MRAAARVALCFLLLPASGLRLRRPHTSPARPGLLKRVGGAFAVASASSSKKTTNFAGVALIGGVSGYCMYAASREQEEENERIDEENKRLEQLQSDFRVDNSVFKDDDLMASLKKRMGDGGGPDGSDGGGGGEGGGGPPPPEPTSSPPPPTVGGGGGAAVLEPPAPSPAEEEPPTMGSDEEVERLKRMFNLGDGE